VRVTVEDGDEEASMRGLENARARAEAMKGSTGSSSASRARMWAGLNRYPETEVEHDRKVAKKEQAVPRQQRRQSD
jgi:hypothetical protein